MRAGYTCMLFKLCYVLILFGHFGESSKCGNLVKLRSGPKRLKIKYTPSSSSAVLSKNCVRFWMHVNSTCATGCNVTGVHEEECGYLSGVGGRTFSCTLYLPKVRAVHGKYRVQCTDNGRQSLFSNDVTLGQLSPETEISGNAEAHTKKNAVFDPTLELYENTASCTSIPTKVHRDIPMPIPGVKRRNNDVTSQPRVCADQEPEQTDEPSRGYVNVGYGSPQGRENEMYVNLNLRD